MACMCGDYCCPSCGPAQGNTRCPICRGWKSEGCDHIDEESGSLRSEFVAEAERAVAEENEMYARLAAEYADDVR
jgi:hypothetical protein